MLEFVWATDWPTQQVDDKDLKVMQQWVQTCERPPWEVVSGLSVATKGLWSKFNMLHMLDRELQWASWHKKQKQEYEANEKQKQVSSLHVCRLGVAKAHYRSNRS